MRPLLETPFLAAAVLVTLLAGSALAQQGPVNSTDPAMVAQAVLDRFDAAYNRHDAAGIAALYTQDGNQLPAHALIDLGPIVSGRANITRFFSNAFHAFSKQSQKVVKAGAIGDGGIWYIGELHLSGDGGRKMNGVESGILVREGEAWQLRMTTATANLPLKP